jgi:SAM-dependent methyltransferase
MSAKKDSQCEICNSDKWEICYRGPIRSGSFGSLEQGCVSQCANCGVQKLGVGSGISKAHYEYRYREMLHQPKNLEAHYAEHEHLARFTLNVILAHCRPRNMRIADIGAAGGIMLDYVKGVAKTCVAIEPDKYFGDVLGDKGYSWYPSTEEALAEHAGSIDLAISSQVIEHVDNPLEFVEEIYELLTVGGTFIASTPNRADILMKMSSNIFESFFYRSQHRWYFDNDSLKLCVEKAGFSSVQVEFVHRYGLANAFRWLIDGKPPGQAAMEPLDREIDDHWSAWLSKIESSDTLYVIGKKIDKQ